MQSITQMKKKNSSVLLLPLLMDWENTARYSQAMRLSSNKTSTLYPFLYINVI